MANADLVRSFLRYWDEGDIDAAFALMSNDII